MPSTSGTFNRYLITAENKNSALRSQKYSHTQSFSKIHDFFILYSGPLNSETTFFLTGNKKSIFRKKIDFFQKSIRVPKKELSARTITFSQAEISYASRRDPLTK